MFSSDEKKLIAAAIEKVLMDLKHPEMPSEKPYFTLTVLGKNPRISWARIVPNWNFDEENPPGVNPFNEIARDVLPPQGESQ